MSAKIIDGKKISEILRTETAEAVKNRPEGTRKPGLAVIIVGDDPASKIYVNNKKKACEICGFNSYEYAMPADTSEKELLSLIDRLNNTTEVDGILCQLPLPSHIDENKVIDAISPEKDVDGFSPVNTGNLLAGKPCFAPCTPAGVVEMLKFEGIETAGKHCVIVGRSNIVGKPAALLMLRENATVTICHSRTENLPEQVKKADIVIAAIGKANFITEDMIKEGAVVIDVGINRLPDGKVTGDVDFEKVKEKAAAITPVPGGVGPMTITMLMKNTLEAWKRNL
ncbi:MAG: bifunctional methylenetetrahydrofolate dehydrogenase/methenyltetrahydrofolate cyclohydrolase FolD [Ruminococcaceae bacterium]|nr:bifunctional methylenetetrahydrofolate dehydrogenase/methenyltetrahydrofolate cyclohydrolase FolD [Oscillospiraceae bacterium]MBR3598176.1 bifunctional methylenetetrahydrofolate dehydrogenase/methenyltetrahydrofolate cyclohydrolase FolD [Clostridia bacterium]